MLIDSHTHIGTLSYSVGKNRVSELPEMDLLTALSKYSIDFALVSSIEGAEFDSDGQLIAPQQRISQLDSMNRLVNFVMNNSRKLAALIWVKPYTEECDEQFEEAVFNNRRYIAGLKMHPTLSNLEFTDKRFIPYIKLARKYGLPVQVHTENDGKSNVKYIGDVADKFHDVRFIMVHMGLNSDNVEAIDLINSRDNVFGDICLVEYKNIIKAIEQCGSDKILFGSDAIVNGLNTYVRYIPILKGIKIHFGKDAADNIFFNNCQNIYNITLEIHN